MCNDMRIIRGGEKGKKKKRIRKYKWSMEFSGHVTGYEDLIGF